MAINCDFCHKPLTLMRRLRGERFCSPEHMDLHSAQQTEVALQRLAASMDDSPLVREPVRAHQLVTVGTGEAPAAADTALIEVEPVPEVELAAGSEDPPAAFPLAPFVLQEPTPPVQVDAGTANFFGEIEADSVSVVLPVGSVAETNRWPDSKLRELMVAPVEIYRGLRPYRTTAGFDAVEFPPASDSRLKILLRRLSTALRPLSARLARALSRSKPLAAEAPTSMRIAVAESAISAPLRLALYSLAGSPSVRLPFAGLRGSERSAAALSFEFRVPSIGPTYPDITATIQTLDLKIRVQLWAAEPYFGKLPDLRCGVSSVFMGAEVLGYGMVAVRLGDLQSYAARGFIGPVQTFNIHPFAFRGVLKLAQDALSLEGWVLPVPVLIRPKSPEVRMHRACPQLVGESITEVAVKPGAGPEASSFISDIQTTASEVRWPLLVDAAIALIDRRSLVPAKPKAYAPDLVIPLAGVPRCNPVRFLTMQHPEFLLITSVLPAVEDFAMQIPRLGFGPAVKPTGYRLLGAFSKASPRVPDQYIRASAPQFRGPSRRVPRRLLRVHFGPRGAIQFQPVPDLRLHPASYLVWPAPRQVRTAQVSVSQQGVFRTETPARRFGPGRAGLQERTGMTDDLRIA